MRRRGHTGFFISARLRETMPEETLFESEADMTRSEIAEYLRTIADRLDAGEELALSAGGQSISFAVPGRPAFEVKVEREYPNGGGPGEIGFEMELEWPEDGAAEESSSLSIE